MFEKVLIANRGEIAVRIQRSLKALGVASVALYSEADREARHVLDADEALALPGNTAAESYLNVEAVLAAARRLAPAASSSDAGPPAMGVHPGYGFLSENAAFAEACARENIAFIGPTPDQLREFGLKHTARELAKKSQVPLLPGSDLLADAEAALREAERVGYPVMLKSTAGGGGIGMRLCADALELEREFQTVRDLGRRNFADDGIYIEKFVQRARHVEVQIFGDGAGRVVALGERDCSVQRRNQKVIEETPAPGLSDALRAELCASAVRLGETVNYRSAGTVEFVYDEAAAEFYFLEVNTRLQVEHGITENVSGVDLVEWMIRLAAGETKFLEEWAGRSSSVDRHTQGNRGRYSIQARVYAEDPARNFQPGSGVLNHVEFPEDARVDTYIESGSVVSPYYDPLLAKIMVTAENREAGLRKLGAALAKTRIYGIETNREFLQAIVSDPDFSAGRVWTRMLDERGYASRGIDVIKPGAQSSVQAYPGRHGYWDVGVPPSGPMDGLAFRLGNALLNNPADAAGIEMTVSGATLHFRSATTLCLSGAQMRAHLFCDGDLRREDQAEAIDYWRVIEAPAGSILRIGTVAAESETNSARPAGGARAYLTIRGGLDVPEYLGSRATFALGEFGGHAGRNLQAGDVLRAVDSGTLESAGDDASPTLRDRKLAPELIPHYPAGEAYRIGVLYGPHAAPEFFTPEYIETFFATEWEVHYNSARTGVRLIGPKPGWTRPDGGEAGLHPSNIHDNAYAVGAVDFTGDMPIILGPDGPSLGGFVCPATIVQAELWKMGQLRPGDRVRFVRLDREAAATLEREQEALIAGLGVGTLAGDESRPASEPVEQTPGAKRSSPEEEGARTAAKDIDGEAILFSRGVDQHPTGVVIRQSGQRNLLIEYGPIILDLNLRLRVHALMEWLREHPDATRGVLDLTPGIRSLQIHFDSLQTDAQSLVDVLRQAEDELREIDALEFETRVVHMPLAWNDASTRLATEKYMQSVWKDAPWCPDNLEFIRRINGLDDVSAVRDIVFDASYLVMGLGDVYLGAPVATPLDPRHRLVTTKYNPARTWTPQNAVGIGGAYLCVYGMEGPGGYQFVGRTCQVWNSYRRTREFTKPYLLRFFDEIRFYPVSPEELQDIRADLLTGRAGLQIEAHRFSASRYNRFLNDNAAAIADFKRRQQAAFEAERERWRDLPQPPAQDAGAEAADAAEILPDYLSAVESPMHGNVWKIVAAPGTAVRAGDDVLVLEAMKMEVAVQAERDGVVSEVRAAAGTAAKPGQILALIDTREAASDKA